MRDHSRAVAKLVVHGGSLNVDAAKRAQFEQMWRDKVPLRTIANTLGYSFSTLAKLRIMYRLERRYGCDDKDDSPPPSRPVIRLRCLAQQTNWSEAERLERWRGPPHTVYESISAHDEPT